MICWTIIDQPLRRGDTISVDADGLRISRTRWHRIRNRGGL